MPRRFQPAFGCVFTHSSFVLGVGTSKADVTSGPHFPRALARLPTVFFLNCACACARILSYYARHTVTLQFFGSCSSLLFFIRPLPLRAPKVCPWHRKSEFTSHSKPIPTTRRVPVLALFIANTPHRARIFEPDFATTSTLPYAHFVQLPVTLTSYHGCSHTVGL